MADIYAGIEAGGTKWVCAVGSGPGDLRAHLRLPNGLPAETIPAVIAFLHEQERVYGPLKAIGIGSFGPLDRDPASPTFGFLTTSPKPGWAGTDLAGYFRRAFGVPVAFDTDANTAALGESRWGAAQGLSDFVYLTIGTGIGGGGMANGALIHGLIHPEMGHLRIPHDRQNDPFPGICPYHGDCWEGLACGPAIQARWGQPPQDLPPDHPAWALEAGTLALGLVNLALALSPELIILGGGVMNQAQLFPLVRAGVQGLLNDYLPAPQFQAECQDYIVPPALGERSGVLGAIALAQGAEGRIHR
jgi:fructokinase